SVAQKFAPLFFQPLTKQITDQLNKLSTANMSQAFKSPAVQVPANPGLQVVKQQLYYAKTEIDEADVFIIADIKTPKAQKTPIKEHLEMKMVYDATKKTWLVDDVKIQLPATNSPKGALN